jgi:hypothetical protein
MSSGTHLQSGAGGVIAYEFGTYTVSGNMTHHIVSFQGGTVQCFGVAVSVPNALTFTDWANISNVASMSTTCTYTGTGSGAGSTGTKYNVSANGVLSLNGTTLPGATAGTTSLGGQAF